jgi:1-acyl-sn-glycerol-3-phosphate acyltransferase
MARLMRWVFNLLFALLTRREIAGLENLPAEGPYILTSNHLSRLDLPLIYGLIGDQRLTGWAAEKYERHLFFGTLLRIGGGIFIRRGEVDRGALQAAVEWLRAGKIFGMAPEGTRSTTGALIRAKTGAAYLAEETGAPVVPAAVTGTERALRTLARLRRPQLSVRFGHPFRLHHVSEEDRTAALRSNTDEIMCRIAAMLPPEYRGVYADHPRLKLLLKAEPET